jgi:FkbM family methyltransferase
MNETKQTVPILLLAYNRPRHTLEVLKRIKSFYSPAKLYIACDGPKHEEEAHLIGDMQKELSRFVDWGCELKTLYRTSNLGCKRAVNEAISWFFESEEMGIILEDDCMPQRSFFPYCEELLDRFREEGRVWSISGDNFHKGESKLSQSYYASKYFHCWGWATWRRAWNEYSTVASENQSAVRLEDLRLVSNGNPAFVSYWWPILKKCQSSQIDSWAYPFLFESFKNQKIHLHPSSNLIENIGFGDEATHTTGSAFTYPTEELEFPLIHPEPLTANIEADKVTERIHFDIGLKMSDKKRKQSRSRKRERFFQKLTLPFCSGGSRARKLVSLMKAHERFVPGQVDLKGLRWAYPDAVSFAYAYEQIFQTKIYKFRCDHEPVIIDCGANVGISSVYWAKCFPKATIRAVEADPDVFAYLEKNVELNGVAGSVETINKAVWHEKGKISFSPDHADGGGISNCLGKGRMSGRELYEVDTITLGSLVEDREVDLLKVDIEGAECELITREKECLSHVHRLFVEYHSISDERQRLHELINVLAEAGFRIHIQPEFFSKNPFERVNLDSGMDNRLNIFAWK